MSRRGENRPPEGRRPEEVRSREREPGANTPSDEGSRRENPPPAPPAPAQTAPRPNQANQEGNQTRARTEPQTPPSEPTPQQRRREGTARDRGPFWRNRVNTETREETVPEEPSINLEREQNYSRNEEINHLIERVRSGEWEKHERSQHLEQRYGKGALRNFRAWMGGEFDFCFDPRTGTLRHNWRNELGRNLTRLGINTAETAGIMAAIGLFTGGAGGAALAPALIGSTLGRGFAQAWRGLCGRERGMREDLEISRIRYYQKARELADRIGPEEPTEELNASETVGYQGERNAAIRDLVNFVNSSEQHGVAIRQNKQGQPYLRGGAQGEPVEPQIGAGEPMAGGLAGPAMVTGTEVYQPSEVAPNRYTLDDMEKKFEKYRRRWEWIEAGAAMVGGMAGGARAILEAKKGIAHGITDKLARGEIVKLDVDGNGITHGVQRVSDGMRNMWNVASEYVFHYNSATEMGRAGAAQAQILPGASTFGSHVLEGMKNVAGAVNKEALAQATRGAVEVFGGLFAHTAWRGTTNELRHREWEGEREGMKQEQEIFRNRLQPEARSAQLNENFFAENKPVPVVGQEWKLGDVFIEIKEIDASNPDRLLLVVIFKYPHLDYDEIKVIPAEELLQEDAICIRRREAGAARPTAPGGPGEERREPSRPARAEERDRGEPPSTTEPEQSAVQSDEGAGGEAERTEGKSQLTNEELAGWLDKNLSRAFEPGEEWIGVGGGSKLIDVLDAAGDQAKLREGSWRPWLNKTYRISKIVKSPNIGEIKVVFGEKENENLPTLRSMKVLDFIDALVPQFVNELTTTAETTDKNRYYRASVERWVRENLAVKEEPAGTAAEAELTPAVEPEPEGRTVKEGATEEEITLGEIRVRVGSKWETPGTKGHPEPQKLTVRQIRREGDKLKIKFETPEGDERSNERNLGQWRKFFTRSKESEESI